MSKSAFANLLAIAFGTSQLTALVCYGDGIQHPFTVPAHALIATVCDMLDHDSATTIIDQTKPTNLAIVADDGIVAEWFRDELGQWIES